MVGPNVGEDYGGILNREAGDCPESLTADWEYYMDWTDSWETDWTMEINCQVSWSYIRLIIIIIIITIITIVFIIKLYNSRI